MTAPARTDAAPLPADRIARLSGFGMSSAADGYLFRPTSPDEIREAFELARKAGRQVTLRGAGRSYGDAAIGAECVVLDFTRMNRILSWDKTSGLLEAEAGATVEEVWRHTLEDGWWPPVVSGTMHPTLAGALAMNIHGKNNFVEGTLGEHIAEIEFLPPSGEARNLTPDDDLFFAVIGSAGLLGAITKVKLRMKRVECGDLRVLPVSCPNWDAQFAAFEEMEAGADYMVSWIDAFARGSAAGRGLFHAAWYLTGVSDPAPTLRPEHQDLPDTILGRFPKADAWRWLRRFNRRFWMRRLNFAKHLAARTLGNGRPHPQSLVGFSFLLDYVPNWRWAYLPGGFIQYQSFVPKEHARFVFARQVAMQQEAGMESFLAVMKRHRPDRFLLSHAVDGYSLALDFKVTERNRAKIWDLCHRMNDLVLECGGRFYFAKDSTMRPDDARRYLGEEALGRFRNLKRELDPDGLLTSELARRLRLFENSD